MKKTTIIFLFAMVAMSNSTLAATQQKININKMTAEEVRRYNIRRFDVHNVSVWGGVGYSALMHPKMSMTNGINYTGDVSNQMKGGCGGMLGVGYEYHYKHIIAFVGPELRILSSTDRMALNNPYTVSGLAGGLDYDDQIKSYYLSNMREQQTLTQIMLPMMAGGQWNYIYFLAGLKLGYTMVGNYKQQMDVQGAVLDKKAYEEWKEVPSHYNTTLQQSVQKGKNPFGLDVTLSAEVGVNLDQLLQQGWRRANEEKDRPMRMRVALFADFGLNNMSVATADAFVSNITANNLTTRSWQASEWGSNKLNSLLVGAKFTWMLQMNKVKDEIKQNAYLTVYTYDDQTLASLSGVSVQVTNINTKKMSKKMTNAQGLSSKREPIGDYSISATRDEYEPKLDMAYYHTNTNDTARIGMRKIVPPPAPEPEPIVEEIIVPEKEQPIILENMFFATNATTILPESEASLNQLYLMLEQHPSVRIRITGHTDNVGRDEDNQKLSEGRANSVRQAMIDRGIDPGRVEAEGKGESEPIDTNDTEEGRQRNRRVEFMVL